MNLVSLVNKFITICHGLKPEITEEEGFLYRTRYDNLPRVHTTTRVIISTDVKKYRHLRDGSYVAVRCRILKRDEYGIEYEVKSIIEI
ncbi:MAG: hypothetical protein AABX19_04370 [Nanoarchaeota archaeon]